MPCRRKIPFFRLRRAAAALLAAALLVGCLTGCSPHPARRTRPEAPLDQTVQPVAADAPAAETDALRWYYDRLSPTGQQLYREMLPIVAARQPQGSLTPAPKEELDAAFSALCADHPELFWLTSYGGIYSSVNGQVEEVLFRPGYSMTEQEIQQAERLLQAARDRLLQQLQAACGPAASDADRALYLYEQLACGTRYDEQAPSSQTVLSCLVYGRAVCAGYSRALQYLLNAAGIPCTYVSGTADGQPHAWNLALLDGSWYYLDATWGDTDLTVCGPDGAERELIRYEYFTMTLPQLLADHTPDGDGWPDAAQEAGLYAVRSGGVFSRFDPEETEARLCSAARRGDPGLCLFFADDAAYAGACAALERGDFALLLHRAAAEIPTLEDDTLTYLRNDARRVLLLVLPYRTAAGAPSA